MKINEFGIKKYVKELIDKYIGDDIVVGVLRYGAHLPHIYQNACSDIGKSPKPIKLLLSHMLTFFPSDFYAKNKFVLLDDTVFRGTEILKLKSDLNNLGAPEENIRTATLFVHNDSKYDPDFPIPSIRLREAEYIAWKEVLGSLVANDIRPTERDHPLYFFGAQNIEISQFLRILQDYGELHSVGTWNSNVLKISLTVDSTVIKPILRLDGVDLGNTLKVRFYWAKTIGIPRLTIVPMGFPVIDLKRFMESGSSRVLAHLLGLKETFYEELCSSCQEQFRGRMLFYFASRSIAAFLLMSLLQHVAPRLHSQESGLKLYWPEEIDREVRYIFPQEYVDFYNVVFSKLKEITEVKSRNSSMVLFDNWKKPEMITAYPQKDPLLPSIYTILSYLVKDFDPAIWDGKNWIPNYSIPEKGASYQELFLEFQNGLFISKALDELLESGLLRAKDLEIDEHKNRFARVFLPGGEYNAVAVSRIAETLMYQIPFSIDPKIIEEEAIDLWGPY
jgi:hypothetical protein